MSIEPYHLFRYLDEQCFRFNNRLMNDAERFALALEGVIGKRLTYAALTGSELPKRAKLSAPQLRRAPAEGAAKWDQ